MKKIVSLTILTLLISCSASGQKNSISTGSVATGTGGTACYSVGQIDYITTSSSSGTIHHGLQQPYEIQIMTGIESTDINLTTSVFPNPTSDFVFLTIAKTSLQSMNFILTDGQGKILSQRKLEDETTNVPMTELAAGVYFISVTKNNQSLKTFKIIKTQ